MDQLTDRVDFLSGVRGIDELVSHAFCDWNIIFERVSRRHYDGVAKKTFDDSVRIYELPMQDRKGTMVCCSVQSNFLYAPNSDPFQNTVVSVQFLSGPRLNYIRQIDYLKKTYRLKLDPRKDD